MTTAVMTYMNESKTPKFQPDRLVKARKRKHFTQEQVETALGLGKKALSKYERGDVPNPSSEIVHEFANLLEVSADWLMDTTTDMLHGMRDDELPSEAKDVLAAYFANDMDEYIRLWQKRHPPKSDK